MCLGKGSAQNLDSRCEHWAPARLCKDISAPWSGLCTLSNTRLDLCQPLHRPPSLLRLYGELGASFPQERAGREEQTEMKALLVACLVVVLYVDIANSLTCYTCTNQTSNDQCLTSSPCPKNETGCVTRVDTIGSGAQERKLINKYCISSCAKVQKPCSCCSEDKCNRSKASGMRPPIAVLGTAVLVSVTRPLLWTGL